MNNVKSNLPKQINYKGSTLLTFLILIVFSCEHFERNNPNDTGGINWRPEEIQNDLKAIDIDGNEYPVVILGEQIWTIENLQVTRLNDGTKIVHAKDSIEWLNTCEPSYCFYKNNIDTDFQTKWGALYNWYAVNSGKLAPKGWHIPSDSDWVKLKNYLVTNGYNWDGSNIGNKIAKSLGSTTDWYGPVSTISNSCIKGAIYCDMINNNKSGFSALPSGVRTIGFEGMGRECDWWTSSVDDNGLPIIYYLQEAEYLGRNDGYYSKTSGLSLRLVKNNDM